MTRVLMTMLLLVSLACSCGGQGGQAVVAPGQPEGTAAPGPASGLPGLQQLEAEAGRTPSIAGPGWYDFDLLHRSFAGIESGVTEDGGMLDIEGAGGNGFSVFGVHGFDGDNYPTSLHAEVADVTGEYFLAYTNYTDGRWRTAGPFTASTTYEYPELSEYSDPDVHVSARTNHFAAVIVPDGSALTLMSFSVGIHGGDEGPVPVLLFGNNSNEDVVNLLWDHSPSYYSPDFAGYSLERKPFLGGESVQLTTENIFEGSYVDDTAELGTIYLYRLTTWDTAGNSAASFNIPGYRQVGGTSDPVCVVQMPKGPLTGPVDVTFDLSASYDNDGDAFTQYDFDFGLGLGVVSQPDPVLTVTLQPGCYNMRFTARTGPDSGSRRMQLKVYPQWEQESHLVDEGTDLTVKAFAPRSFYDAQSDKVVFLYADPSVPSIASLTVDRDGNIDRSDMMTPFEDLLQICSEPELINGTWHFIVAIEDYLQLCTWTDNEASMILGASTGTESGFTSLVNDPDGSTYVLYHDFDIGYDIFLTDLGSFGGAPLVTGLIDANYFDAAWNPDAEALDLVYSGSGTTEWMRWSPVIGPVAGFTISAADSEFVDIEVDPATGRPAALIKDGPNIRYTELNDDDSTWTAPEMVDVIDPDWPQTKLVYRDGTAWCYIGHFTPGGSSLYRKDGASWTNVNDADFGGGGIYCTMDYFPSEPGFLVLDVAEDFKTRITMMQDNGDEDQILIQGGFARSGFELSAAGGSGGIHLLHKPAGSYIHWFSADGTTWTQTSNAGAGTGGKIVADQNGEIYSSLVDAGTAYLRHWVDPAWVVVEDNPISNLSQPLIYGQGNALVFGNFDGDAFPDEFHYKRNLDPSMVFQTDTNEIWEGAIAGFNTDSARMIVRYGGINFDDGNVGVMNLSGDIDYLFEPSADNYGDLWTLGRHLEGASYTNANDSRREVFYVAYGASSGICRIWRNDFGEFVFEDFPTPHPEIDFSFYRRTVTATTAWGNTAVGMGGGVAGQMAFFEWDNYGNWEALPVPDALQDSSLQELVVGPDGRWHIIYRDYVNEDLRVISTVN